MFLCKAKRNNQKSVANFEITKKIQRIKHNRHDSGQYYFEIGNSQEIIFQPPLLNTDCLGDLTIDVMGAGCGDSEIDSR